MRTPILIRDGSFTVLTEKPFKESRDPESERWRYTLPFGFVNRASVDAVTWDGERFRVTGDRQHRRPAEREVRLWFGSDTAGIAPLIVTIDQRGLALSSEGRLERTEGEGRSFQYRLPSDGATEYAYQVRYPDGVEPLQRGLRHLAVIVNGRWDLGVVPGDPWAWLAVGAGLGVIGGLLLGGARDRPRSEA